MTVVQRTTRTVLFVGGIAGDGMWRRVRGYPKHQRIVDETPTERHIYVYQRKRHRTEYHLVNLVIEGLDGNGKSEPF